MKLIAGITLVAIAATAVGCGSSTSDSENSSAVTANSATAVNDEESEPEATASTETDSQEPQNDTESLGERWSVTIGDARYTTNTAEEICLSLPGDTFVLNASGATESGALFQFYLANESGPEFEFEIAGNESVGVSETNGDEITVTFDPDSGDVFTTGIAQNGVPFTVTGTC